MWLSAPLQRVNALMGGTVQVHNQFSGPLWLQALLQAVNAVMGGTV